MFSHKRHALNYKIGFMLKYSILGKLGWVESLASDLMIREYYRSK